MGFAKPIEQFLFSNLLTWDTCICVSKRYYTRRELLWIQVKI